LYDKATKPRPSFKSSSSNPSKAMIEKNPSFDYRMMAHLLGMNKNTVQRMIQLIG